MCYKIGLFYLLLTGIFVWKSRGWQCDWERAVARRPPFGEINLPFGRVTRQEDIFKHNSGRPFGEKHPEYLVQEDGFQLFQFQRRRDPEHAVPVKAAIRHQKVTVEIKSEEVAKALKSNACAGDGIVLMCRLLDKDLQEFPSTTP